MVQGEKTEIYFAVHTPREAATKENFVRYFYTFMLIILKTFKKKEMKS